MSAITSSEVFSFIGAKSDVQTTHATLISSLIANKQKELEERIGRKLEPTSFSSILFHNGLNCTIKDDKLFLKGIYRDIYSITSLYEEDTLLTDVTAYNDGKDYYYDAEKGVISRNNDYWSTEKFAIKITGKLGLVVSSTTETTKPDLKQALIEMVAAASGLWTNNFISENGTIETTRQKITAEADLCIKKYQWSSLS